MAKVIKFSVCLLLFTVFWKDSSANMRKVKPANYHFAFLIKANVFCLQLGCNRGQQKHVEQNDFGSYANYVGSCENKSS